MQGRQAEYYSRTAGSYDSVHGDAPEHDRSLQIISQFIRATGAKRILDVGTGTGRAVRFLSQENPEVTVIGLDPVSELLDVAVSRGVERSALVLGSGDALPFADRSFDVVCALGVLHHVRQPDDVVREMRRVSRNAVFISDANRFGQGTTLAGLTKLALYKLGLWWPLVRLRNRGARHHFSDGDGVAYSYSVYDNLSEFRSWESLSLGATLPKRTGTRTWLHPLLTSPHVLLCAVRSLEQLSKPR